MIAELSKVLDGRVTELITISSADASAPHFLIFHFIDVALRNNRDVILVSARRGRRSNRVIASKLAIRSSEKIKFINIRDHLKDDLLSSGRHLLKSLDKAIGENIESCGAPISLMFDDFSIIHDIGVTATDSMNFLRKIEKKLWERHPDPMMVVTFCSDCPLIPIMQLKSDVVLQTSLIGTGFAKDVTGKLSLRMREDDAAAPLIYHYRLTDRSVQVMPPGLLRPAL
ncbi:hypothetical protein AB6A40_005240 [Gnathostoma spinigerum]|uniref:Elongator complex protein 6 n=1 Tax=Gnathostoma spinigerum TaxID=75299 RepID=A0ABD6EFS3_9BILA